MHPGIDGAALRLAEMGRVHAISCLVGGTSWTGSSPSLRRMDPLRIDIGLHLDLTETPLLGGSRRSLLELIIGSYLRTLDRSAIRAEIRAQLDAFDLAMGRGPAFVDGHQHVHQLPVVRGELLAELRARGRGSLPWIRSTCTPSVVSSRSTKLSEVFKPWVISWLGSRALGSAARRLGYPQNRCLLGVYDFKGGRNRYQELLAKWLSAAGDGDLLMCHPSALTSDGDSLSQARQDELEVLASDEFDTALRRTALQLVPMSKIVKELLDGRRPSI